MQNAPAAAALRLLRGILIFKISATVLLWAAPLLLFPVSLFEALMGQAPEPISYARLLGVAYLALIVNYAGGYLQAKRGVIPWVTIWTGLVSNGGGLLIVIYLSATGGQQVSSLTLVSMIALILIVGGLTICAAKLKPPAAMAPMQG